MQSYVVSKAIVPMGQLSMRYGHGLLKDISASSFARLATGNGGERIKSNHPAWVYGHLAVYPSRMLELIGHADSAKLHDERFKTLFKDGTECLDDAAGTIYPPMAEIVERWDAGHKAVLAAVSETPDEVFARQNPTEGRAREMLPTVGAVVGFLLSGHPMSHLGQASAWRRFMGMPSAM